MNTTPSPRRSFRRLFVFQLAVVAAAGFFAHFASVALAADAAEAPAPSDQVIRMSQFEVTTTEKQGYVANNAARAFKTDQALLNIPQTDIVITSDMINDAGFANSSDLLQYVGLTAVFEGEPVSIRGSRDTNPYVDDMPDSGMGFEDNVNIDSYEVIKGPAAVLYAGSSLSGVVVKSTKKPLPYAQNIITETVSEWGMSRTTFDSNTPFDNLGAIKLRFRIIGAFQRGKTYWRNKKEDRDAIHPGFEVNYQNTTVRVAYDFEKLRVPNAGFNILQPNGSLYTGAGRKEGFYPPNGEVEYERIGMRAEFLQRISEDWENRFQAQAYKFNYFGVTLVPQQQLNWQAQTDLYKFIRYAFRDNIWIIMDDVTGHFHIGPVKFQSNFGFLHDDQIAIVQSWTGVPGDSNVLPIGAGAPAAFDAISVPPPQAFAVPANPGTRAKSLTDNIYYQQQVDIIPDRLSLVGGFTWANIETITDTNQALNAPYPATDANATQWLHRFGAVLHVTKDVSLYALNSTSFTGGVGVDVNNNRLPNVLGTGNEVGIKTAFLEGRLSSTFAVYHMKLTNQAILAQGQNFANSNYYIPIGSTTSKGFDGDLALAIVPGWQLLATFYVGTVADQTGNTKISATYDNSWSVFTRYDFSGSSSGLKGLGIGGGVSRVGSIWLTSSGFSGPVAPGYVLPAVIKLHEGLPINLFADYKINKHWTIRASVTNLLNQAFPVGGQTVDRIDPIPPLTVSGTVSYRF